MSSAWPEAAEMQLYCTTCYYIVRNSPCMPQKNIFGKKTKKLTDGFSKSAVALRPPNLSAIPVEFSVI